ncbi:shikimate dehydrogenase [Streptococcus merionis]|uniref:Shikimate dehydrogenase (NADP(+)) n=1 Tax=Streptococcus merionis TaxID=400065 RepID=A0A239SU96_9STRE|nr:shikimate dehydrogenase [Streptococcus merionis]SNU88314.1 shikimate 5-dehydrogenase [Streptococcus merionis]
MKIDGYTRLAAVVARPIRHSLSPMIHNAAFEATAVNGVYVAWDIAETDLQATLENVRRYDMFGINLSMPYKSAVIPYLDELSPEAALIGAVNTVVNSGGKLIGHNTDGQGFLVSLGEYSVAGQEMAIIGAGGAGLAIIAQAALNGARAIHVFSRQQSVTKVSRSLEPIVAQTGVELTVTALNESEELQRLLKQSSLLVNSSSLGMDGHSYPLPAEVQLPANLLVADIIYHPFETPLLKRAKSEGLPTINGLGMLLHQAALAFELWTGKAMPVDLIWPQLEEVVKTRT